MQLYSEGQQKLKWKDPRTCNAETQAHADADELGIKKAVRMIRCVIGMLVTC
jgi:hypothetical protein